MFNKLIAFFFKNEWEFRVDIFNAIDADATKHTHMTGARSFGLAVQ